MSSTCPTYDTESAAACYQRLASRFARRVESVPTERWDDPSPCEGWSARDVLRHVIETETDMIRRLDLETSNGPSVDDSPVAAWRHTQREIQRLLDDPETANRGYDGMFGRSTLGEAFSSYYAVDLVVHGWDIAHATGTDEVIAPDDLRFVQGFVDDMSDDVRAMMRSPGGFGPEVEFPPDADKQTKLIAFLGRRVT